MRFFGALILLNSFFAQSQTITETFGNGSNQFSIEFVEIGNPGNTADTTGDPNLVGSVNYIYNLGKFEITREIIEKANSATSLNISLTDMSNFGGNGANRPASGITWLEAARFVNHLNSSKGYQVAYKFDTNGNFEVWSQGEYSGVNQFRHKDAYYFLPNRDEWYKGAYGSPDGTWYNYTTGNDTVPSSVSGGLLSGTIVAGQTGPADVFEAGGLSAYGTMGQGGNIWEWNESAYDVTNDPAAHRDLRGGSFYEDVSYSDSSARSGHPEWRDIFNIGFRVASVPEPSSLSFLLVGGAVLMAGRRRKRD